MGAVLTATFTFSLPHHLPQTKVSRQRGGCGSAGSDLLTHQVDAAVWGTEGRAPRGKVGIEMKSGYGCWCPSALRAGLQAVNAWYNFSPFCWSAMVIIFLGTLKMKEFVC